MRLLKSIVLSFVAVCLTLGLVSVSAAASDNQSAETVFTTVEAMQASWMVEEARAFEHSAELVQSRNSAVQEAATRGPQQGAKLVALTFDDGPGADTNRLLDALRTRGVRCTFFIVGRCAAARPAVVKKCYEDGHQIAGHTYTHPYLTRISDAQVRQELNRTWAALDSAIGASNSYALRPPYGSCSQHVLDLIGVPAILWSVDSMDWSLKDADATYQKVISEVKDGDIILLHDSHAWSVDAAIRIVDQLQADGYEFVTVSELFRRRGEAMKAGSRYSCKRNTGTNLSAISTPKIQVRIKDGKAYATITADAGTSIYYTLDGSVPNSGSRRYTGPIPMTGKLDITAVAGYDMNGSRSALSRTTLEYPQCPTPALTISDEGLVTLIGSDTLCYTTDGSTPTEASERYEGPFSVVPGTVVRAIACCPGTDMMPSSPVSVCFSHRGNVFADVFPGAWYYTVLDEAKSIGLLTGVDETHMAPEAPATRAMLAQILYRMEHKPAPVAPSSFSDVSEKAWYAKAVAWAQQQGILRGYPDGTFRPNMPLLRQDAVTILSRYGKLAGYRTTSNTELTGYKDSDAVSNYAAPAMRWAVEEGLLQGTPKGKLNPLASATRAELAAIVLRYLMKFPQGN